MLTVKLNANGVEMTLTGTLTQLISWTVQNGQYKHLMLDKIVESLRSL